MTFAFTDGHADMSLTDFFDDLCDLDQIDWPLMSSRYWNDTTNDPDRTRRRQAEFLVHNFLPWELVSEIAVIDTAIKMDVEQILHTVGHRPVVKVCRTWYY